MCLARMLSIIAGASPHQNNSTRLRTAGDQGLLKLFVEGLGEEESGLDRATKE